MPRLGKPCLTSQVSPGLGRTLLQPTQKRTSQEERKRAESGYMRALAQGLGGPTLMSDVLSRRQTIQETACRRVRCVWACLASNAIMRALYSTGEPFLALIDQHRGTRQTISDAEAGPFAIPGSSAIHIKDLYREQEPPSFINSYSKDHTRVSFPSLLRTSIPSPK